MKKDRREARRVEGREEGGEERMMEGRKKAKSKK